jgi:phenylalanyl-tRNA synthetase beta chain
MKFSEQWLREWVDPAIDTDQLVEQMTLAGLEVDDVKGVGGEFTGVIVAKIVSVAAHPKANKLQICQVNDGSDTHQVVCGAPNVRAAMKFAYAPVGARLPGNVRIGKVRLRQIESFGMLCSAAELQLGEDNAGIMELPQTADTGMELHSYLQLNDRMIDVDLTPNRSDCLSIAGLAQEVGALNSCEVKVVQISEVAPDIEQVFPIKVSATDACPRYVGRVLNNIDVSRPSPLWLREKLRRCGLRSIDPVVDITHYVLLELGQPMHAFDLDKLSGGINVRMASQGETLTLLDDQQISLDGDTLVIADNEGAVAMAGIMGGCSTGVSDQTVNVFLEAAFFSPTAIAGKARSYGLHTESSHRFERGVDYNLQRHAIERATILLQDIVGGEAGPIVEQVAIDKIPNPANVVLRKARLASILAHQIDDEQVLDILQRLGLELVASDAQSWTFEVPSCRFDISIEADLIEEVARVYGYNNLPATIPTASLQMQSATELDKPVNLLRWHLVSRGYQEAITYSMVSAELQAKFDDQYQPLALANPISTDMAVMRTNLWPGLIKALHYNQNRQQGRIRLFEIGQRFVPENGALLQQEVLSGVVSGARLPEGWGENTAEVDFFDVKGDLETLFALDGVANACEFLGAEHVALHPGQAAAIQCHGHDIGWLGKLHPELAKVFGLSGAVFLFELILADLQAGVLPRYQSISRFPEVRRDLAVVLNQEINVADIKAKLRQSAGQWLTGLLLFDLYQGPGVENGKKSLSLGLTWQHPSRTLRDEEVNQWVTQSVMVLKDCYGASLRN